MDVPVSVYVVVEGELLALDDVPLCKDAHPHPLADDPLCHIAVWVAAVVREPTNPALLGRVQELKEHNRDREESERGGARSALKDRLPGLGMRGNHRPLRLRERGPCANLVFLKHHEVEVPDSAGCVLPHPLHERRLLDDLANVLVDERVTEAAQDRGQRRNGRGEERGVEKAGEERGGQLIRWVVRRGGEDGRSDPLFDLLGGPEPVALSLRLDDLDVGVLFPREPERESPAGCEGRGREM